MEIATAEPSAPDERGGEHLLDAHALNSKLKLIAVDAIAVADHVLGAESLQRVVVGDERGSSAAHWHLKWVATKALPVQVGPEGFEVCEPSA